jgi:hypothetical protein
MSDLPFDAVVIANGGDKKRYSALDFMRLPLNERIQVILERRIEFLQGELTVDRSVALQSLMATNRS